jgi:hypothetical protein
MELSQVFGSTGRASSRVRSWSLRFRMKRYPMTMMTANTAIDCSE